MCFVISFLRAGGAGPSAMRKLCWWALPCSAAIFIGVRLLPEQWLLPLGIFCGLGGVLALLFHGNTRRKAALAIAGLAFGFLWTGLYGILFREPARSYIQEEPMEHTFEVCQFPTATSRGVSFSAKLVRDEGHSGPLVILYAEAEAGELIPGDLVRCPVRLVSSQWIQGQEVDHYEAKGIYLLGYVEDGVTLVERPEKVSPRFWPQYVARELQNSMERIFPQDIFGFFSALITGEKRALPAGVYRDLQRAGIAHVVAVSGLHISFLAGLAALIFGKRSRLGAVVGIGLMVFFAAVAGNTPSALRAACMASLLLLAPLVGREPDKPTTLSAVLVLLLLPRPYAAASVSLQLSFGAVAGIYLLSGELSARWLRAVPKWDGPLGRILQKGLRFLACSLAATAGSLLFTTPMAAVYFRSVSLAGPVVNLLTLWAVSLGFLGGLWAALLGLVFLPAGQCLAWLVSWPARWVFWVARGVSRLPFSSVTLLSGYLALWFVAAYGILLLWILGRRRVRPLLPLSALVVALCAALVTHAWPLYTSQLTVTALDVGQGASTLFCSKGRSVLVDCGGNGGDDPGDIAADHVQAMGSSRLDALILTHYHSDHAGGVPQLLSRLEVSLLILPGVTPGDPLREEILDLGMKYGCEVIFLTEDSSFSFGDAVFTIYAPLGDGGANEEGLSLLCSAGDFDVLVTGDMNDIVERRLVKYKNLPDIEILMVGHHGSKNSTSKELLLAVTPETAVISSGYNSYGHPAPETLERLGAAGCDIYCTKDMGNITFTYKGE